MRQTQLRFAIDCRTLDQRNIGCGPYRYAVDVVRGLALANHEGNFILLGSKPKPPQELEDLFEAGSKNWHYDSLPAPNTKLIGLLLDCWRVRRWVSRKQIHLYHNLDGYPLMFSPCKAVVTLFDIIYQLFPGYEQIAKSGSGRFKQWAVPRFVDHVITISDATAKDLSTHWKLPMNRMTTTLLAVSDSLKSSAQNGVPHNGFSILSHFHMDPRKNMRAVLEAVYLLRKEVDDARLVLYGRCEDKSFLQQFMATLKAFGLEQYVRLTGFLSDSELAQEMSQADVFVYPSLYEGFGYPLLEAMSAGTCCVSGRASSMPEVGGDAVEYANVEQPSEIAAVLRRLYSDPAHREDLGNRAKSRASLFTVERLGRQTLGCWLQLLSVNITPNQGEAKAAVS